MNNPHKQKTGARLCRKRLHNAPMPLTWQGEADTDVIWRIRFRLNENLQDELNAISNSVLTVLSSAEAARRILIRR